jgi:hypothetical protein
MVQGQSEDVKLDTQPEAAKAHAELWLDEEGNPDEEGGTVGGQG